MDVFGVNCGNMKKNILLCCIPDIILVLYLYMCGILIEMPVLYASLASVP